MSASTGYSGPGKIVLPSGPSAIRQGEFTASRAIADGAGGRDEAAGCLARAPVPLEIPVPIAPQNSAVRRAISTARARAPKRCTSGSSGETVSSMVLPPATASRQAIPRSFIAPGAKPSGKTISSPSTSGPSGVLALKPCDAAPGKVARATLGIGWSERQGSEIFGPGTSRARALSKAVVPCEGSRRSACVSLARPIWYRRMRWPYTSSVGSMNDHQALGSVSAQSCCIGSGPGTPGSRPAWGNLLRCRQRDLLALREQFLDHRRAASTKLPRTACRWPAVPAVEGVAARWIQVRACSTNGGSWARSGSGIVSAMIPNRA